MCVAEFAVRDDAVYSVEGARAYHRRGRELRRVGEQHYLVGDIYQRALGFTAS